MVFLKVSGCCNSQLAGVQCYYGKEASRQMDYFHGDEIIWSSNLFYEEENESWF